MESREEIENLRTMLKKPREFLISYCLSLNIFCSLSRQTAILICYDSLCFTAHGWYMQNDLETALFNSNIF